MAVVKPFKAIRPTEDKASFVATRSYEEYSKEELKSVLKYNPFSFLHILNPGFKFHKNISGKERFRLVHNRYLEFLEDNIFLKDEDACFYLYQISKGSFKTLGFFCACSVLDYQNNVIRKHEDTIQCREKLFADYLDTVGFNAEPVLMTYEDNPKIGTLLENEATKAPVYNFTTTDKYNHQLWKIDDSLTIKELQNAFEDMDALYIADGHHRSASSHLLAEKKKAKNDGHSGNEAYNYFMAYLIPETAIKIYEFNRMVKDLNGHTKEEFLIQLDELFRIEKKDDGLYKPTQKHHFSMYLDGNFYSLALRKSAYEFNNALSELDAQILFKTVLKPILGIDNIRNSSKIIYSQQIPSDSLFEPFLQSEV